jgi:cytochrome c oxidase subunit I
VTTVRVPRPRPLLASAADLFRTCQVTGYQVHAPVQRLIVFQAVSAVLALATGGTLALLMALTRWEAVRLLPPELYYRFVSAHGTIMLVFWIVFFEIAALLFGGTILINHRLKGVAFAWGYSVLMAVGAVVTTVTALSGQANNMFTAYPPLVNHPAFYLGILLFAVGALAGSSHFVYQVWTARREGVVAGPLPLVVYALLAAAIIAIWTLLHGALAYAPALLQSLGLIELDPAIYRTLFWGFGHGAQQINLAAMVACWYALATLTTGARPVNEGLSRLAFVLYLIGINMGSMHHLLVDPGVGMHARIINTSYFMYAALLGSLIHAFSVPAAIETALRARGHTRGLFGWLRNAPWREPGFAALMISLIGFGFVAGVSGVLMGTMQLNMIIHNTLFVVGHFHATVVLGTTMAFMGLSFYVVPMVVRRDLAFLAMARWQPYVYGAGLLTLIAGLMAAGKLGAARRSWDATYSLGNLQVESLSSPLLTFANALIGIGGIIAVTGGIMYVLIMVGTVFVGHRNEKPAVGRLGIVAGTHGPRSDVAIPEFDHRAMAAQAPGTTVAVYVFLAYFVVMFGWAFFNLARVGWGVG